MRSLHTLILSCVCIVSGVVTHIYAPDGPIAMILITAGIAGTGGAALQKRFEDKRKPGSPGTSQD